MSDAGAAPIARAAAAPARALLSVAGLSVLAGGRRSRTLVRDVSFQLAAGETLAIVGESGSGKSMTARSIVGLLPPGVRTHGDATLDGRQLIGAGERALRGVRGSRIALLLQDPFTMLNPLQSARAHVVESLPRALRRDRRRARAEADRRLAEVGIDPGQAGDRCPFQLSGGMRQRVALAAALARDPELLIADEPTTALDVTTQAEILALLERLRQRRGMAVLLITHDLRVAFSIADRALVMYAGSIIEEAPARDLSTAPEHPYSLGLLLAEPPVAHVVERLRSVRGNVPTADEVADRCAFDARCDWREPRCSAARPPLAALGGGRASACVRIDDIREQLRSRRSEPNRPVSPSPSSPPRREPVLELADVRKVYRSRGLIGRARTVAAVRGVSFRLAAGESVGLVGETGSGKTTIARCVLGLATPDAGAIRLAGIDVSSYRRLDRSQRRRVRQLVQPVFQDPYSSLNPALAVGAALREAIAVRDDGADPAAEIAELLALVGLPAAFAQRRPAALSGGERQRIAIARAVATRPTLMVCDEPVASLDVSVQAQILELLRAVRRRHGMSMLFVTHDLAVVRQMTDRVVVLHRGEVVECGETAAVLDAPTHPYTIRLLASVPAHGRFEPGG